jgi:hypothetical protein
MRRFGVLILIMALAIRLAVPTGWMPGEQAMQLTVCTGVDTETVWLDSNGDLHNQKPENDSQHDDKPCAFGGFAGFDGDRQPTELPSPPVDKLAALIPNSYAAVGIGLAAPPPQQTGPPSLI